MRPFDATRADIGNWSDIEISALTVAMKTAHTECQRLEQSPREGEELYALARLCSLGQDWPGTYSAATRYLRDDKAPHLPQAYYLAIQADLNLKNISDAVEMLKAMNTRLPLTAETNAVFEYALTFIQFNRPDLGIEIALIRQPKLLQAVSGSNTTLSPGTAEAAAWQVLQLLRFDNRVPSEINGSMNDLQQAIAARTQPPTSTDAYIAAVARRRYEAIGNPMPKFAVLRSTGNLRYLATPTDANLYVLYPEDCASCASFPNAVADLKKGLNTRARAWALIEATPETSTQPPAATTPLAKKEQPKAEPPALYTNTPIMQMLGAEGVPFYVVTDRKGNIRFLATGSSAWLHPDSFQDILIQVILERIVSYDDEQKEAEHKKRLSNSEKSSAAPAH